MYERWWAGEDEGEQTLSWLGADRPSASELKQPIGLRERIVLSVGFLLFFELYYPLNAFTASRETWKPLTALDEAAPFIPAFVFAYVSIYYISVVPAFLFRSRWVLRRAIVAYTTMSVISFIIFLLFPVEMVLRPQLVEGESFASWLLAMIYAVDHPYNCCPSLHVGLALMGAFTIDCVDKRFGRIAWAIAFLVCISTLVIKQHYIIDVIVGYVVAYGSFWYWLGRHRAVLATVDERDLRESRKPSMMFLACYVGLFVVTYLSYVANI